MLDRGGRLPYIELMAHGSVALLIGIVVAVAGMPAMAQSGGAASIDQVPTAVRAEEHIGVQSIPASRSSATDQNPASDKVPPLVSAETLAACQKAQQADRPAPANVDCVKALQVVAARDRPSAEGALLPLFGQNAAVTTQSAADAGNSVSADQVSRQLSSGGFHGIGGNDAAASVARDRPPPQTTPPPR